MMNIQKKRYRMQFFSTPDDWLHSQSPGNGLGTCRFPGACRCCGFRQTHGKKGQTHRKGFLLPSQHTCTHGAHHPWYGIFPLPSLAGCLAVLPPSSSSSAECEKLEKVLDFVATTENITVTSILLVLNPKQLLGGK